MSKTDYNNLAFYSGLGFKSGIEIHQQIFTRKKLFCHCPAGRYSKVYDAEILRHMRPTLSELGEYDGCALMEFKTKKDVVYQLNRETVCTYEMDDTPPFTVNQEGLDIVIEIALLLNCSIVDEMHISRKQYLDGSIPTGFQRTAVVGINGWIPFKGRKITISHICYEEDACRQVSNVGHRITFRTDRLGMPLIEVITGADFRTPEEARQVVNEIGRLIRATKKVRRGLGSVRQDVNSSVAGGSRVEIKGVPRTSMIPALLHNEALRQENLLKIKNILAKRSINDKNLNLVKQDLTKELAVSKSEILRRALNNNSVVGGIKLNGLSGILNHPAQPGTTLADEISDRVRIIACLDELPNMFHTDKFPAYDGASADLEVIKKALAVGKDDVAVVVWGSPVDVQTALEEVRLRIIDAIKGVPNETRRSVKNGITDFERILPGANRMYPDTDSPPTKITQERVNKIKASLPEAPWAKEQRYVKMGMAYSVACDLAISDKAPLAEKIIADYKINPTLVGAVLTQQMTALKHKGAVADKILDESFQELFELYGKGLFHKEAIPLILVHLAQDSKAKTKDIIQKHNLNALPDKQIDQVISDTFKSGQFKAFHKNGAAVRGKQVAYYSGLAMKSYRGRINGVALRAALDTRIS
jgi:glutamyl-tRNA(Gln) amidotransferase subunit E